MQARRRSEVSLFHISTSRIIQVREPRTYTSRTRILRAWNKQTFVGIGTRSQTLLNPAVLTHFPPPRGQSAGCAVMITELWLVKHSCHTVKLDLLLMGAKLSSMSPDLFQVCDGARHLTWTQAYQTKPGNSKQSWRNTANALQHMSPPKHSVRVFVLLNLFVALS